MEISTELVKISTNLVEFSTYYVEISTKWSVFLDGTHGLLLIDSTFDGLGDVTCYTYLSQNAKRASARKDTGLDQSLFYVQLFRLRINII